MTGARWFFLFSAIALGSFTTAEGRSAEPGKDDRCLTNKQLIESLATIHNHGRSLYNSGDVAGCYRYFQGALAAVHPLLPKDLQDDLTQELIAADRNIDPGRRAYALHELIEYVRKRLHPSGAGVTLPKPRKVEGETDEPPKSKDLPKKGDAAPLLLEPPKKLEGPTGDTAKPKPVLNDGLNIPLPKSPDPMPPKNDGLVIPLPKSPEPVTPPKKEPEKKSSNPLSLDVDVPPLKIDPPAEKPLIAIPSGSGVPKPPVESLPPPRIDVPLPTPAIPTSNPKPSKPMPPVNEPPMIILPPGK
jgi:hypothetical protein